MNSTIHIASFRRCLIAGAGAGGLLCGALAQPAAAPTGGAETDSQVTAPATPDSDRLQEILVTAEKRESRVNDVPMSITAIGGSEITKLGVKSVDDLTRVVPGFQASPSGFGQQTYFLRGIGFFDTSLQSKPTVTVYTDEEPYPLSPLSAGAPFDLERVEVLKGPQGTLFGSNATGGAINFIANKPTNTPTAGVDVSYGRFNDTDVSGFVSGPIADTLTGRLALRHESADPWQVPYTAGSPKNGAKSFSQGRLILDWRPNDQLKVELNANGFLDEGGNQASQYLQLFPQTAGAKINPGLVTFPAAPYNDRSADGGNNIPLQKHNDLMQGNLRIDYQLTDDTTLTSLTSGDRFTENYGVDVDGTPYADQDYRVTGHVTSVNQEVRIAGTYSRQTHWVVGVNYENDWDYEKQDGLIYDSSSGNAFARFGLPPIYNEIDVASNTYISKAIFGNVDYDITHEFTFHAGARYTETSSDFAGCLISSNATLGYGLSNIFKLSPPLQPGQCLEFSPAGTYVGLVRNQLKEHDVPWRVGLDWKPSPATLLYGNISRGFKSGGFPNLGATDTVQYTPVKQEEVTAYELGVKKTLLDDHLQVNGAIFYDDYLNKQLKGKVLTPIFGTLNAIINIPKSEVKGAELQATWNVNSHLKLNAGATYLQTVVLGNYLNYTYSGALDNFKGAPFPYTPKWQANADGEYDWSLSDKLGAYVGSTVTYRSDTNSEFIRVPVMSIKSYTLLDLRAGVTTKDGRWRVQLAAYNVTDEYYWTQVGRISDAITRLTGMPATYAVSFSYRYH
jgi:outer membrane receptor protein involved in Fe transport